MQETAPYPLPINPLINIMRQPKIYIKLPSNGKFWPEGSLKISPTGEYPVYSMTAKDELVLKTPDALLNGQAIVDVIQSCVPNVVDAWQTPQIDIDVLLIAVRIATYGENMESTVKIKDKDAVYPIDLRMVLDNLYSSISWNERIEINENLIVYVKPITYQQISKSGSETFETQRILNVINDKSVDIDEKVRVFKESFAKLTQLTIGLVANSVYRIDSVNGSVNNQSFINEFIENCDREVFNKVKETIDGMREKNSIKPLKVKSTDEMIEQGAEPEFELPLIFDASAFFG